MDTGIVLADATAVEALIWHASDSAVKPIVANRRIERLPDPRYDPKGLPFTPLSLQVGGQACEPPQWVPCMHTEAIGAQPLLLVAQPLQAGCLGLCPLRDYLPWHGCLTLAYSTAPVPTCRRCSMQSRRTWRTSSRTSIGPLPAQRH